MKLFIVLACFLAVAAADHGKKGKQSKNPVCSKELSVKPTDCCPNMPSFKQYFEKCATQCNQTNTSSDPAAAAEKLEKRGKGEKGNKQFFRCVMPCVIQNAGILGADGNISSDLLTQQLLSGASSEWSSIVPTVVSSCFANATAKAAQHKGKAGKDKLHARQSMTGSQNKTSERLNGMIMKCTFKNLYLACPAPVDSSDCKDLNTKFSQCPCEHGERGEKRSEKKGEKKQKKNKGKSTEEPAVEAEM
ncbi:uncharacterized protein [Chironomus tepperi]|uniref:uncharacterized protein n=1 Tax=Chironomus tepperi TaxID=113505 RepID=UPI00391FB67B